MTGKAEGAHEGEGRGGAWSTGDVGGGGAGSLPRGPSVLVSAPPGSEPGATPRMCRAWRGRRSEGSGRVAEVRGGGKSEGGRPLDSWHDGGESERGAGRGDALPRPPDDAGTIDFM